MDSRLKHQPFYFIVILWTAEETKQNSNPLFLSDGRQIAAACTKLTHKGLWRTSASHYSKLQKSLFAIATVKITSLLSTVSNAQRLKNHYSIFTVIKITCAYLVNMISKGPQACFWRTIIFRRSCQKIIQHKFISVVDRYVGESCLMCGMARDLRHAIFKKCQIQLR